MNRRHGRDERALDAGSPRPFDGDVAGVPRRCRFRLEGLVVLVEHEHVPEGRVRDGRPRRHPGPHDADRAVRGRRPVRRRRVAGEERDTMALAPQPVGEARRQVDRGHDHDGRPEGDDLADELEAVGGGGKPAHDRLRARRDDPARARVDRQRRRAHGRGWRGDSQQVDPAAGPAPRRPAGEVDHLGRRAGTGDLGQRLRFDTRRGLVGQLDDPSTHAAAVQLDADDRPDADLVAERVRHQVVERLLDRRQVRQDPGDHRRATGRGRSAGRRPGSVAPR